MLPLVLIHQLRPRPQRRCRFLLAIIRSSILHFRENREYIEQANVCWCIQIISLFHVVHTYKISLGKAMKIAAFFFFFKNISKKVGEMLGWTDNFHINNASTVFQA